MNASVVFLRAVNVGGANVCRPATIAKELSRFDIVNIGAVGTFVVRGKVNETALRAALGRKLPFKCEMMICSGNAIAKLIAKDPFVGQPCGADITRFVSIARKRVRAPAPLPVSLPAEGQWLLRIVAVEGQFVLGVYRRHMKAIGYLGRIEKLLGQPLTTRSWSTIEKVAKVLAP